jgi:hypothetical protein
MTKPVDETHFFGKYLKGKTIAGCENVNGIFFNFFLIFVICKSLFAR